MASMSLLASSAWQMMRFQELLSRCIMSKPLRLYKVKVCHESGGQVTCHC